MADCSAGDYAIRSNGRLALMALGLRLPPKVIASGGYILLPVLLMKSLIVTASLSSTMVTSPRATRMPAT